MRWLLALGLMGGALVGCTPDIQSGTYYCGPERFCPPDLACDDSTFTCIAPYEVQPFACPDHSEDDEPNDTIAQADDLGALTCGAAVLSTVGCVRGGDLDYYRMDSTATCNGSNPHLKIKLRFPVADVPLSLDVVDENGTVVVTGEDCTPMGNVSGRTHLCVDFAPEIQVYYVRVQRQAGGADCNGACNFNQYLLDITYPLG